LEHGSITILLYEGLYPGVHRRSLQRDLKELVERGLLEPEGATNRQQYVAGQSLV
jgi:Fic family protein